MREMETTYTLIKRLEDSHDFWALIKRGIIPLTILNKKVYFEYYKNERAQSKSHANAIFNTSEEYNVSESTIRRAIKEMEA